MSQSHGFASRFGVGAVLAVVVSISTVVAADKESANQGGKAAGILIEKKNDSITVKVDGDDEPTKYAVDTSNQKLVDALRGIFDACRVQLTFKKTDDARQLVGIQRQVLKDAGIVTGDVVKVYNDFWIEVKPKNGLADAYAPGGETYNDKAFMERLKGLKKGDSVTITYTTDFERHRIKAMRINPAR